MEDKRREPIVSLDELLGKNYRFASSQDALKDVTPPKWSKDVLDGKRKIIVGTKDEVR